MPNSLSKIFVFIVLVGLLVIVPTYKRYDEMDNVAYNQIQVVTSRFQKDVVSKGYIDISMYQDFVKQLGDTKKIYDIHLVHRKLSYYPLEVTDPRYNSQKPFIESYEVFTENSILPVISNKSNPNAPYKMKKQDDFTVTVQEKGLTNGSLFRAILNGNSDAHPWLYASYGGMVQNEID
jgi:hypothetical protein